MNVETLITELQKLPKNALVVLAADSEGNGFSPLSDLFIGLYEADNTYSGQFSEDYGSEYAVCLWPTN